MNKRRIDGGGRAETCARRRQGDQQKHGWDETREITCLHAQHAYQRTQQQIEEKRKQTQHKCM